MTIEHSKTALLASLALSASAFALTPTAIAQEANDDEEFTLEEITVVATRREKSIQEVAVAVSVVGGQLIETIKPRDLRDLTGLAPNLHIGEVSAGPASSAIFIRGLGYNDIEKSQNPPVGVAVDGIFLGTSTGQLVDAFDVEQMEVSRGPQGIFFGKNTTGGVINVRRSKPTREFGVKASAAYGSHDELIFRAVANVPLGDKGGLKFGGTYREHGGIQENLFTGGDEGAFDYTGFNVHLDYDLTEWANVTLIYDRFDLNTDGNSVQYGNAFTAGILGVTGLPGYNPETGSPIGLEPRQVINDFDESSFLTTDIFNATLTFDTPLGEFVSVTGYVQSEENTLQDFDGTCFGAPNCPPGPINFLLAPGGILHTERPQDYEQFTQEFRLAGDIDRFDYLVGFFYYDHQIRLDQVTNGAVFQEAGENNDAWAFFGNLDYRLTDTITLSAGMRYINEDKDFFTGYDLALPGITVPLVPQITDDVSFDDVITRFAVDWQATDDNLIYLSRAEGFRSGGISMRGTLSEQIEGQNNCVPDNGNGIPNELLCPENNFLTYEPETVTSWELGSKNTLLNGELLLNAAYFRTTIEGLQVVNIVVTPGYGPGTNTYINNLPEAEIEGFEMELTWRPRDLPGFTLSGVLGIQDGEVTDGTLTAARAQANPDGTAGTAGSFVDFTGTVAGLDRISDYNYNITGTYEFALGTGMMTLSAGYNYIDDHGLSTGFGGVDIQEGYGLLNAYIGYAFNENLSISLSGRNLTNKDYRVNSLASVFFQRWADDRNWLLELQARF